MTALLWFLSCWFCLCLGARLGSRPIHKRITRLVLIRGRTKNPRVAWVDAESLDAMEERLIGRFVQGRLVAAELQLYDTARRMISEKGRAA